MLRILNFCPEGGGGKQAGKHGIELRIMHGILSFEIIKNSINISYYYLNVDGCLKIHNFEEGGFWYGIFSKGLPGLQLTGRDTHVL